MIKKKERDGKISRQEERIRKATEPKECVNMERERKKNVLVTLADNTCPLF